MIRRVNDVLRRWWPTMAAIAAAALIVAVYLVIDAVLDERAQLRHQNALLTELVGRQRVVDAEREARLEAAVDEVERRVEDLFAVHDENVAVKLNDQAELIAVLLGRPAGEPQDPVTARSHRRSPEPRTPPPERDPPPSTTTTTSPGQSDLCERIPLSPICRSTR